MQGAMPGSANPAYAGKSPRKAGLGKNRVMQVKAMLKIALACPSNSLKTAFFKRKWFG
jgi:hypothetical protein